MSRIANSERLEFAPAEALEIQRRMAFLAEAGKLLMASLDYRTTCGRVARLMVPVVADYCIVYGLQPDTGAIIRVGHAHVDSGVEEVLGRLLSETVSDSVATPLTEAMRTGWPLLFKDDGAPRRRSFEHEPNRLQVESVLRSRCEMILPLEAHGNTLGALLMGVGDSDRRYTTEDLKFAVDVAGRAALSIDNAKTFEDAKQANRLKEEFLATLSHELRTPLTAILGYARLLDGGRLEGAAAQQAIQSIHRNAQLQNQLISDLLDISRIVTGKLHLEMSRVELGGIIESALDSARLAAEDKSQELRFVRDRLDAWIAGDPDRLHQVVANLISNAIKFTPKGGLIEVRLRRSGACAEIIVSDNGIGVSPDFLPHVFDKFRQADNSNSRQNCGLGLGLAIVRHLVEMHGGSVDAESQGIGKGAQFKIRFPTHAIALRRAG